MVKRLVKKLIKVLRNIEKHLEEATDGSKIKDPVVRFYFYDSIFNKHE